MMQKRLRKERRARRRLQEQLDMEMKRRAQLEDALKSSGAPVDTLRILTESTDTHRSSVAPSTGSTSSSGTGPSSTSQRDRERERERERERDRDQAPVAADQRSSDTPPYPGQVPSRDSQQQPPPDTKPWNYSQLDLMSSGAAFWQNYSVETLAQELEMERKSRQQQAEKDVKSPLQDRSSYYKNSVLFTSAT